MGALGPRSKRIDPALAGKLLMPARELFGLVKDYIPGSAGCQPYATDQPTVSLTFAYAGVHRGLRHYLGCANPPEMLSYFERQVEATADVGAWIRNDATR